ncbi:10929_t:CDS:2, partial [Dentiscutata erythropus]
MVDLLKPFEEITKHVCGSKYPTLNIVYPYVQTLKKKFTPKSEDCESFEAWIDLIYGSEDQDTSNNSSLSSNNEADILSAGNRRQWQYAHRSANHNKNRMRYKKHCSGLLEKARAVIFLTLDELWNTSNIMGLKASILDPRFKLLPFATIQEQEETKMQVCNELSLLKTQINASSNVEAVRSPVIINEDPQDSLSAELWDHCQYLIMILMKMNLH